MKRLNWLLVIPVIFGLALFTGCEETEDSIGPELNLVGGDYISNDVTVTQGAELYFKWTAIAGDKKLETFSIQKNGAYVSGWANYEIQNSENDTYSAGDTLVADQNEGSYEYLFVVTDRDGLADSVSIMITVESSLAVLSDDETLTAQADGPNSAYSDKSFYSLATNSSYTLNEVTGNESNIDLVFVRHATLKSTAAADFTLRSPDQENLDDIFSANGLTYSLSNKNSVYLKKVTVNDWDNLDVETVNSLTDFSETTKIIDDVADGEIIAIKLADGSRTGLARVVSTNPQSPYSTSTISLQFKYVGESN